jgi:hypothetical protein
MPYSPANAADFLLLVFTVVTLAINCRRTESNLPLIYFGAAFVFSLYYPGVLPTPTIYAGAIGALFLRFEFLGPTLFRAGQFVQAGILVHLAHSLYRSLT